MRSKIVTSMIIGVVTSGLPLEKPPKIDTYIPSSLMHIIDDISKETQSALAGKKTLETKKPQTQSCESERLVGYVKTTLNVRKQPTTESKVIGTLTFNQKITYTKHDEKWVKIKYDNKDAYVCADYITKKPCKYTTYTTPRHSFKSYMSYKMITLKSSKQYKLQHTVAYTGNYGIRMINGRYCAAIGTGYDISVGDYVDLVLKNGTIIPIIISDIKDDKHTDSSNRYTRHDSSVAEFIVDNSSLVTVVKRTGDISNACKKWDSPIVQVKRYSKNVFKE